MCVRIRVYIHICSASGAKVLLHKEHERCIDNRRRVEWGWYTAAQQISTSTSSLVSAPIEKVTDSCANAFLGRAFSVYSTYYILVCMRNFYKRGLHTQAEALNPPESTQCVSTHGTHAHKLFSEHYHKHTHTHTQTNLLQLSAHRETHRCGSMECAYIYALAALCWVSFGRMHMTFTTPFPTHTHTRTDGPMCVWVFRFVRGMRGLATPTHCIAIGCALTATGKRIQVGVTAFDGRCGAKSTSIWRDRPCDVCFAIVFCVLILEWRLMWDVVWAQGNFLPPGMIFLQRF